MQQRQPEPQKMNKISTVRSYNTIDMHISSYVHTHKVRIAKQANFANMQQIIQGVA